jgi:pimeloyl-ACP methyl ester carboxylesterase
VKSSEPSLYPFRQENNQAAFVFLHGFGGDYRTTWMDFPAFLAQEPRLKHWDIFSLGYASSALRLDVTIWSADPEIRGVADLLRTHAANLLGRYQSLAMIAHSMGGLAVQRALVDDKDFVKRVSHVLLFGTPSGGLAKAWWVQFWKRSVADMATDSPFITGLRKAWSGQFNPLPFRLLAVAGDQDEFVPRASSIDLFTLQQRAVVPGNHVEIVKPHQSSDLSVQVAANFLAGEGATGGPWSSDRIAIEFREFEKAIENLLPHADELDEAAFVQLCLALESVNRQDESLKLLETRRRKGETDAMGVLAGRLKRRWMVEHREDDAKRARELYTNALNLAEEAGDKPEAHAQAYYHGINVAFMELTYGNDREAARAMAKRVLDHCKRAQRDRWNLATQGEASMHTGEDEEAVSRYREAVETNPTPRELGSMYRQAIVVARHLGKEKVEKRLEDLFRSGAF